MVKTAKDAPHAVRFRVVASHHPALALFVLSTWRRRWCARLHAWLWIRVLGDGALWPDAIVEAFVETSVTGEDHHGGRAG